MKKLAFVLLVIALCLTGCGKEKKEPKLELFEKKFYTAQDFPFYVYSNEEELSFIKNGKAFDASKYRGMYDEFEDLTHIKGMSYVQVNNEFKVFENYDREFYFPERDGTYLLTLEVNEQMIGSLFKIGNGNYEETLHLPIFNSGYSEERIVLAEDIYQHKLFVEDFDKFFDRNLVLTKEQVKGNFFKDFDYYVYAENNATKFDVAKFRNGNQILYKDELYYIKEVQEGNEKIAILNADPIHFTNLINEETIEKIEVIYFDGMDDLTGTLITLTKEEQEDIKEILSKGNLYNTPPLMSGTSSLEYAILVTTDKDSYTLTDHGGPLVVKSSKSETNYNACYRIYDLLENVGFNFIK